MRLLYPTPLLRLEGGAALIISLLLYRAHGGSWLVFALAFFAPDISIPCYAISNRVGFACYNFTHTYVTPAILLALLIGFAPGYAAFTFIWFAHISWDRLAAFGLKQSDDFWDTHLGRIVEGRRLWERFTTKTA